MSSAVLCKVQAGFVVLLVLTVYHLAVWRLGLSPLSNRSEDKGVGNSSMITATMLTRIGVTELINVGAVPPSPKLTVALLNASTHPPATSESEKMVAPTSRSLGVNDSHPSNKPLLSSPDPTVRFPIVTNIVYDIPAPPQQEELVYQFMRSSDGKLSTTYLTEMARSNFHRKTYNLLWSTKPCVGTRTKYLIMVNTPTWHVKQREAIRETWGRVGLIGNSSKIAFLIGQSKHGKKQLLLEPALTQELMRYGDLIRYDFQEDYLNLTIKSMLMLRWASKYCPDAQYLIKVDDDMWVNFPGLKGFLANTPQNLTITGYGWKYPSIQISPVRQSRVKYYVPKAMYSSHLYPPFVSGTTYVITMALVPKLLASSQNQKDYVYLEDVFLLGLCADQIKGVTKINVHGGFSTGTLSSENTEVCSNLTTHGYSTNQLYAISKRCQDFDKASVELSVCKAVISSRIMPSSSPEASSSRWAKISTQCRAAIDKAAK